MLGITTVTIVPALACVGASAPIMAAEDVAYPTADEAAHQGFIDYVSHYTVVGPCVSGGPQQAELEDACYDRWQGLGDETFAVYSAHPYLVADIG